VRSFASTAGWETAFFLLSCWTHTAAAPAHAHFAIVGTCCLRQPACTVYLVMMSGWLLHHVLLAVACQQAAKVMWMCVGCYQWHKVFGCDCEVCHVQCCYRPHVVCGV
jgi:hypothetical protein